MSRRAAALLVLTVALATGLTASATAKPKSPHPRVSPITVPTTEGPTSTTTATSGGGGAGGGGGGGGSTATTSAPAPAETTTTTVAPSTTTSTTAPAGTTRQAALWPFSAESPWNIGVGSGATFESTTDPRTASLRSTSVTPWVNAGQYSHPIYQATTADPLATVSRAGFPTEQYRIPLTAVAAGGSDAHLHVVEPDGRWLHEAWSMIGGAGVWTTGYHVKTDLHGPGMGQGGVRAYGGSAIGGLIRTHELDQGTIPHAVAMAISSSQLKRGWVWPATTEDGNAATSYTGQVPMGTFAAIPPGTDLSSLGLSAQGLTVAKALQDYGAYVVDRSGCVCFFADPGLEGTTNLSRLRTDMAKLRNALRVVTNNSSTTVNGGGSRRVAAAPAFG